MLLPKAPLGLCEALDGAIYRIDGEIVVPVAHYGPVPGSGTGPSALSSGVASSVEPF